MRHIALLSCVIVLLLVSTELTHAQFRSTNNTSTIEINDVDIDPLATPLPTPKDKIPTTIPSTEKPQVIDDPIPVLTEPDIKRFLLLNLSQSGIDFGSIDPTNPVIRTHLVRVTKGNASGLSLFAYENRQPVTDTNAFIPDTSCDDGSCTQVLSGIWENTLTYGFGYRCDSSEVASSICSPDFLNQQSYKQFADVSRGEAAEPILNHTLPVQSGEARVTIKVNVPGTQPKGTYRNAIIYLAAPMY